MMLRSTGLKYLARSQCRTWLEAAKCRHFSVTKETGKTEESAVKVTPEAAQPPLAVEFFDRIEICKKCPKGTHVVSGYPTKCDECGCLIQAKAMFPVFHCPLGKW